MHIACYNSEYKNSMPKRMNSMEPKVIRTDLLTAIECATIHKSPLAQEIVVKFCLSKNISTIEQFKSIDIAEITQEQAEQLGTKSSFLQERILAVKASLPT